MEEVLNLLKPLYLNSLVYASKDWRLREECSVNFPVQRRLCKNELVADFDNISDLSVKNNIINWFKNKNFKFAAYNSSSTGLHIHFFTNLCNKYHKIGLLKEIEDKLNADLGNGDNLRLKIDLNPLKSNHIRAENSFHPKKQEQKTLIYSNLSKFFYVNELDYDFTQNLSKYEPTEAAEVYENDITPSMKFILNNAFGNGRKRLLFVVVSWYKSRNLSNEDIFKLAKSWCDSQPGFYISNHNIWATVYASTGMVRENYRKELLEELGFPQK